MFKIALLFGGPSMERGVSLSSARCFCDCLNHPEIAISLYYVTPGLKILPTPRSVLYQNTPDDFDFKLAGMDFQAQIISLDEAFDELANSHIVIPAGHGAFFEDGELTRLLEEKQIPCVGTPSANCLLAFDKARALEHLSKVLGTKRDWLTLCKENSQNSIESDVKSFCSNATSETFVVKPTRSGSSIDVFQCSSPAEVSEKVAELLSSGSQSEVLVEQNWKDLDQLEFSVLVVESSTHEPVALLPTEVICPGIYTYSKKYLPSEDVGLAIPGRLHTHLESIRARAVEVYTALGMRDFGRLDGWLSADGTIRFSDFNVISGLGQTSFFFLQFAHLGFSHAAAALHVISTSCTRQGITQPPRVPTAKGSIEVDVLMGGTTSERQVSVQSGTNVCFKLRATGRWITNPKLLTARGVFSIPPQYELLHTCEDIERACNSHTDIERSLEPLRSTLAASLRSDFGPDRECVAPHFQTLPQYLTACQKSESMVFLALHGGIGENGVLQAKLEQAGIRFTGSPASVSALCAEKATTNAFIDGLGLTGLSTPARFRLPLYMINLSDESWLRAQWYQWIKTLGSSSLIIKPASDGCSTGVARLSDCDDLIDYLKLVRQGEELVPPSLVGRLGGCIRLPRATTEFVVEEFIETATVAIKDMQLIWDTEYSPWVEVTVGVFERQGRLHCMNPSVTVRAKELLSLEEKFQTGTGINLTPPPREHVADTVVDAVKDRILRIAKAIGIQGFARLDAFINTHNGHVKIIEINTLPGMTPATAIFHQALAENPPIPPGDFLELAIFGKLGKSAR
ncbi:MAG: hypothetical protein ABJZ55_01105 [Fuerstiella sp.]